MNRLFYGLLLLAVLNISACSSKKEENLSEFDDQQKVVLAFDIQGAPQSRSTQDLSREDNISQISVFIFNSATAEKVYEDSFQASYAYQVRIKPGTYDFYFIANETDLPLYKMTRDDLDRRLDEKKVFRDYSGDSNLPMARVYRNQRIQAGGTIMNPQKFVPQLSDAAPLFPISLFGQDEALAGQISLVRAVAKISVNLIGEGLPYVSKMEYVQASSEYSLGQLSNGVFSQPVIENIPFQKVTPENLSNYSSLYIPERIFSKSEEAGWRRDVHQNLDEPMGNVNYIQITMYGGTIYKIPIVSNGHKATGSYLDFARNDLNANYNIIRNNSYEFRVGVPLNHRELNVELLVQPWNVVESEMSYRKPKVTVERLTGRGDYKNIDMNRDEIIKFKLSIQNANGQDWKMALSNGLDFVLQAEESTSEGELGAYRGAAHDKTTYIFGVKPLKPYEGTPRFTELYLLVNGKEIPLFDGMKTGPNNRTVIKQTEIR